MAEPGLCGTCEHVKRTETRRGSVFYMCVLASTDAALRKYPPLPVRQCHGYRRAGQGGDGGGRREFSDGIERSAPDVQALAPIVREIKKC